MEQYYQSGYKCKICGRVFIFKNSNDYWKWSRDAKASHTAPNETLCDSVEYNTVPIDKETGFVVDSTSPIILEIDMSPKNVTINCQFKNCMPGTRVMDGIRKLALSFNRETISIKEGDTILIAGYSSYIEHFKAEVIE